MQLASQTTASVLLCRKEPRGERPQLGLAVLELGVGSGLRQLQRLQFRHVADRADEPSDAFLLVCDHLSKGFPIVIRAVLRTDAVRGPETRADLMTRRPALADRSNVVGMNQRQQARGAAGKASGVITHQRVDVAEPLQTIFPQGGFDDEIGGRVRRGAEACLAVGQRCFGVPQPLVRRLQVAGPRINLRLELARGDKTAGLFRLPTIGDVVDDEHGSVRGAVVRSADAHHEPPLVYGVRIADLNDLVGVRTGQHVADRRRDRAGVVRGRPGNRVADRQEILTDCEPLQVEPTAVRGLSPRPVDDVNAAALVEHGNP